MGTLAARLGYPRFLIDRMVGERYHKHMISTTHILSGAAIGLAADALIPNPAVSIPVAFIIGVLSHHVADMIPHTDAGSFRKKDDDALLTSSERRFALVDNILGTVVVLAIFFAREASWPMLFGAAGANFPDIFHHPNFWAAYTRHKIIPKYFKFHEKYHWTARANWIPFGVVTNLTIIMASLYYLLSR